MSGGDNDFQPRTGLPLRLTAGPKAGQRSLYQQQVLDEDSYTDALSHIITRDFFPNLPHIHATNAYLTALTNNDPELLSSSIRRLAALAKDKEDGQPVTREGDDGKAARQREYQNMGTPYISLPGGNAKRATRTPVGARGWDTPAMPDRHDEDYDELDGEYGELAGPSRPKKKRKVQVQRIRDDLSLDAFQRNYTSEDNASFVQIVKEENQKRREERWGWAWEAEKRAETRRIEGEERRKAILEAATSGNWRVDGDGRRLIGGLAEPGRDRAEGEAWRGVKSITGAPAVEGGKGHDADAGALVHASPSDASALILSTRQSGTASITEQQLPEEHPLNKALTAAGLPGTALVSRNDGAIVPHREVVSGSGEGRGRGEEERTGRTTLEKTVMGDEQQEHLSLGGSGGDIWGYKTRNNFMFPADADADPYPKPRQAPSTELLRQAPPAISHANTRLPDDDEVRPASSSRAGSRRGSSPARSWVDAAVKGTPYRPGESSMPSIDNYPLLPKDPSPSPQDLPSLLTWGTLLATPRALDGSDDPLDSGRPAFKLPETKRRDEIGRKLGDKASRSMNARAQSYTPRSNSSNLSAALRSAADKSQRGAGMVDRTPNRGGMLPPSSTPRRTEALTPAARQLLQRSMGVSKSLSSGLGKPSVSERNRGAAMEKGSNWSGGRRDLGGMSWTPSPGRRK